MLETRNSIDADERRALDERLALIGVLQELTSAVLDLFDPSRSLDEFLQKVAARLGARVALLLEEQDDGRVALRGAAGLSRASRSLEIAQAPAPLVIETLPLPFSEVAPAELVRWIIPARIAATPDRPRWLALYFEREPRLSLQYRGMTERLVHHLSVAFDHRKLGERMQASERALILANSQLTALNENLERRVDERTQELARMNEALTASLESWRDAQDQLLQSGKLAALGKLAAGLAHEINNPLAVILGFSQGLERRIPEGDPLRHAVVSIVREALRCMNLVQELLTFSRTTKRVIEEIDVNEVVRSAASLLEPRARTQGTRLSTELAREPPRLKGIRQQLEQVLVNLGNNSLDALEQGGAVVLRSRRTDAEVLLEVEDTGPGVPVEIRARIFEPFFTTKPVGKGTGLGLSLAHEIVQQHGGSFEVDSEPGRSTVMRVRLPVDALPRAARTTP